MKCARLEQILVCTMEAIEFGYQLDSTSVFLVDAIIQSRFHQFIKKKNLETFLYNLRKNKTPIGLGETLTV